MKSLIIFFCFTFVLSNETDNTKIKNAIRVSHTQVPNAESAMNPIGNLILLSEPYALKLNLQKIDNKVYDLEIQMELNNGAHFVSPNAKRNFSGKFTISLDENSNFNLQGDLIEAPLSKEEYDSHPFVNGLVNWVKVNTTYKQQLKVTTQGDFQVMGFIQFTIEPRCTLEKIPIIIKSEKGILKFEIFQC